MDSIKQPILELSFKYTSLCSPSKTPQVLSKYTLHLIYLNKTITCWFLTEDHRNILYTIEIALYSGYNSGPLIIKAKHNKI